MSVEQLRMWIGSALVGLGYRFLPPIEAQERRTRQAIRIAAAEAKADLEPPQPSVKRRPHP